jgi:hypothetical protein
MILWNKNFFVLSRSARHIRRAPAKCAGLSIQPVPQTENKEL